MVASELGKSLATLGALLLFGLATETLGRKTRLPRVTLLMILGFAAGPSILNLVPDLIHGWFPAIADVALVMVGFLLGGRMTTSELRQSGRDVLLISVTVTVVTALTVLGGLYVLGTPLAMALLLAGVATATAPAAIKDVVKEAKAEGPFTRLLLGIVAVDDAWGLILFSITLSLAQTLSGGNGAEALLTGAWELIGAVLIGAMLGVPMAYLSGRIKPGEPTTTEALGMVLLCCGLSIWLNVSFLLAAMVMGFAVANLATHHERPLHAIEMLEWPFLCLFFVLAGASMEIAALKQVGIVTLAYVILRIVGRIAGAQIGARMSNSPKDIRRWVGPALLPQAGVALGMALIASQKLPEIGGDVLSIVIAGTICFELIGPILTRLALTRVGELNRSQELA